MLMPGLLLYLHNWSHPSVQSTLNIHYFEPHCKLLWQRPLFIILTAQESHSFPVSLNLLLTVEYLIPILILG